MVRMEAVSRYVQGQCVPKVVKQENPSSRYRVLQICIGNKKNDNQDYEGIFQLFSRLSSSK